MYCGGPSVMRAKTAEVLDSADAGTQSRSRQRRKQWHTPWNEGEHCGFKHRRHGPGEAPSLSVGNIVHFVIAVFFLWPIFLLVAVIWSLGDAFGFLRYTIQALVSSSYWLMRVLEESVTMISHHPNSATVKRVRGRRRALGHEVAKDWQFAGKALLNMGRIWSKTFGLGGLFKNLEEQIEKSNVDWRRYVATEAYDRGETPSEFPEQYVVIDELPRGGSSARLYVVRKADEPTGTLYVLKYFDLRAGGNLESVVRESQAAQLAQKLGLIMESMLGEKSFWYVMPHYSGETLTRGVLRNIKLARENDGLNEHNRLSLGYVHQLLQIIAQYHEAGVFHKDIKPDNLIINGEKIYLVDIGLMTPLSSMAQLTTHGTEYFRDPEMVKLALEGREVRQVDAAKFDVYSIGAVLFFALSGEFPTSGALSRLPREVPLAAQWVVNRAMTGMQQRYANARAMLTDIDYLCWAASNGGLEGVKSADLPSFKGMPVPSHLQGQAPDTDRLAAAPGGYGDWYAAPAYRDPDKPGSIRLGLAVFVLIAGMIAVAIGVWASVSNATVSRHSNAPEHQAEARLIGRLPEDRARLAPLYAEIAQSLADGVAIGQASSNGSQFDPSVARTRLEMPMYAVLGMDQVAAGWQQEIRRRLSTTSPAALFNERRLLFVSIETDEDDLELAKSLELELETEAARRRVKVAAWDQPRRDSTRGLLMNVSDHVALHGELASRSAALGEIPPMIVAFTIEPSWATNGRQIQWRMIYPGREFKGSVHFTETR